MKVHDFNEVVNHMKTSGFVYQGSEIYGGLANTWDFGPLGVELKQNIKNAWWKRFIQEDPNNVGIQSAILMNPNVWVASGHVGGFSDPLMDCKECKSRFRADQLIEEATHNEVSPNGWSNEEMENYIREHEIACPKCGAKNFTDIRQFNLMFKTFQGVLEDAKSTIYLRPETAQGIFVNFKNVQRTMRKKLPFGIGQIGKSFRNEITPGNFIFRTREFEQMELEFFCKPGTDLEWFKTYCNACVQFLKDLGLDEQNIRLREHAKEELAHYSNGTSDIEYNFADPIGWGELWGIADRTDFDLKAHQTTSKQSLEYFDPETNEKYIPYVIEPSVGVERLLLALMCEAYTVEELERDTRVVLKLHPYLAPYKVAVLPLSKKLQDKAGEVFNMLSKHFACTYDENQNIGKRYRRQDAIGTPYCVTVDFDTMEDGCVTVRDRDTMEQERIKIEDLKDYIEKRVQF
ncbi:MULTISPECIES: glycine--tRNA ligase [Faecalicoccus]|uniref:Glycine--tRNA ligase n=1 Tax=Faecalicoccus pleomorphus TaxID=1323 RepID=A0A7X9RHJ0_9FIRM|nr:MULTISPECIES: glycine--tRNA ligase [Faecalicoccus]MBE6118879.1 glycine--tRNA ligase [Erysipelotrichaceae bacterium]MCI6380321.1 glycine--tRNA ligase [Erysipelotrichaceae bacterium]MDB7980912.1 glycine--tRNA ligase [Faecalicoccus pleomorphus]MDB7983184.1 glycine--tRNA ligase [Faecalicoccus pleomorphus]MDY4277999.1 glycine--tRNA ligase [Faecalicoccus sp.]